MSKLTELRLQRENEVLKEHLKSCLGLIDALSNLEAPLFKAPVSKEFKLRYVAIVSGARRLLTSK